VVVDSVESIFRCGRQRARGGTETHSDFSETVHAGLAATVIVKIVAQPIEAR
jgi:hypothetical protein